MVWITFIVSAAVIAFAASVLARYGDVIGTRTGVGGVFIGVLLMASVTSIPEFLTILNSIQEGVPNLAVGNLMGSNLFNIMLLAVVDLAGNNHRFLRRESHRHALSGSLALLMISLVIVFILADLDVMVGPVGLDSLILIGVYIIGVYLLRRDSQHASKKPREPEPIPEDMPSMRRAVIGFAIAAAVLVFANPIMVRSAETIAEITGLGNSFVGATLVAVVTSLPEVVATITAVRIGAAGMAIANLFGSNMFNMMLIGAADIFYLQGRFISVVDPTFLLVGAMGMVMNCVALVGNVARLEKRLWKFEFDATALLILYIISLVILYSRGVG